MRTGARRAPAGTHPCAGYNRSYTADVKTAVSLPDEVFRRAERAAKKLGVSRSELYARAIAAYLESFDTGEITKRLDEVYAEEPAEIDPLLSRMQSASIPDETWE